MLQPEGFGAARPVDVPVLIGADGPKGLAVADELGDGVFSAMIPAQSDATWRALLTLGTVLDEGEDAAPDRAVQAAGPALAVVYHGMYERGGARTRSTRSPAARPGATPLEARARRPSGTWPCTRAIW